MKIWRLYINIIVLGSAITALCDWSLPYPKPDTYDYSEYYGTKLNDYIAQQMIKPKERLTEAWKYYAENYIMPNGLVCHLRMDGDKIIGQNEAVSEGIGYGMLLSLINNDQANFNKIFEGGNSQMWKGKSYACWKWNNGSCQGSGCATDADLDIALALVFADKLQENKYWSTYNKNGVTYKSRATELINSIKTTMVSGDLLLPGDAWPNGPTNPSYFSVAAMRVFNAYQKTHDFTGVIKKCYDILENTRNYTKGQAPDWCNSSGGSLSGDGTKGNQDYYGMSIEAIRVPWRIGLDAIWFNDSRAVKYCKNTKNTLTKYGSDEVYAQMIEYKPNGSADMDDPNRQADNFERVAMWSTAVLGSKDKTFTQGVVNEYTDYQIASSRSKTSYFGGLETDKNFYYKQSLGMLGYATIFGLFPNVLADMESIPKIDTVHVTTGLKVSSSTVSLPGKVTFTATLDKAASWQMILTGQTSGKKDTLSDSSAQISVTWDGTGWFTKEVVKATLSVTNLAVNTSSTQLSAQFTITEIVPILKKYTMKKEMFFSIYQGENSLIINAGNNLHPVLNIYKLNGERVLSHKFNMDTRYADYHTVPVSSDKMVPGLYVAKMCDEYGVTPVMVRRFIWK